MWSDHSFSSDARASTAFALEVVYAVDADSSFDALKLPTEDRRRVALRSISGEGELWYGRGEAQVIRAGTVILLDFNLVRRYRPRKEEWRFWYFEFGFEGALELPVGRPIDIPDAARDEDEARECLEALRRPGAAFASLASATFALLYHRWLAVWIEGSRPHHLHEDRVRAAVGEMRRRLGEPLSIPTLAKAYGMSERTFRDAFEAVMEWPPKRYYDRLRLEQGAELLRTNRYSIGQIADQLGYSSAFHFSHAFRELFGVPPSTYASVIRNEG